MRELRTRKAVQLIVAEAIMAELNGRALPKGLEIVREDRAKRRAEESGAAWTFLTTGAADGASPDREPWSRNYDPLPYPEALPDDLHMYEGTGIGALYGLPGSEVLAWQLAGWNLTPRGKEML